MTIHIQEAGPDSNRLTTIEDAVDVPRVGDWVKVDSVLRLVQAVSWDLPSEVILVVR